MHLVATVAVVAASLMPRVADACDCPRPPSTQDSFNAAEIVAVVKVTRVNEETRSGSDWVATGPRHYTLAVERAWKGARAGDVIQIDRDAGRSNCEYELEPDTTHLLYLTRHNKVLDASAPHCTRNQPADRAAAEIAALDQLPGAPAAADGGTAPADPPRASKKSRGCGSCSTSDDPSGWLVALAFVLLATTCRRLPTSRRPPL